MSPEMGEWDWSPLVILPSQGSQDRLVKTARVHLSPRPGKPQPAAEMPHRELDGNASGAVL